MGVFSFEEKNLAHEPESKSIVIRQAAHHQPSDPDTRGDREPPRRAHPTVPLQSRRKEETGTAAQSAS